MSVTAKIIEIRDEPIPLNNTKERIASVLTDIDAKFPATLAAANAYTDQRVSSVYVIQTGVATVELLPPTGQTVGWVRNVTSTGMNYVWLGNAWDALGSFVDLSGYDTSAQVTAKINLAIATLPPGTIVDLSVYDTALQVNAKIASSLIPYDTATQVNAKIAAIPTTNLSAYDTSTQVTNKINQAVATVYKIQPNVATFVLLPLIGQELGWVRNVVSTGMNYVWTADGWDALGTTIDLSSYDTSTQVNSKIATAILADVIVNQKEEIDYFNLFFLPVSQKANIQTALNTHGKIRLGKGDYRGVNIEINLNQVIHGDNSYSIVSNILIKAGASNWVVNNLKTSDGTLTFEANANDALIITDGLISNLKETIIQGTGCRLDGNTFLHVDCPVRIDCSASGYYRNTKVIKHICGTVSDQLTLRSNSSTRSFGNCHVHTNFRTPAGNTTLFNNMIELIFIGIDAEAWNYQGQGTRPLLDFEFCGDIKIMNLTGGNGGTAPGNRTAVISAHATNLLILNKQMNFSTDTVMRGTRLFATNGSGGFVRNLSGGDTLGRTVIYNQDNDEDLRFDNVVVAAPIVSIPDRAYFSDITLSRRLKAWVRPKYNQIPDPLGKNWRANRIGKPDQRAFIQNLINTNGVAELPAGIFYIGAPLNIISNGLQGIQGQGTGRTVICGLTDDFSLLSITGHGPNNGNIICNYLTFQGGRTGWEYSAPLIAMDIAYQHSVFVVFRDQVNGIYLNKIDAIDNNLFENLAFINCKTAFLKETGIAGPGGESGTTYVDKTMFRKCQFINCETAFDMKATRADNMNCWIDCNFEGGQQAFLLAAQNAPMIINCDFHGYNGKYLIESNAITLVNVHMYDNNLSESSIKASLVVAEGCYSTDTAPFLSPVAFNEVMVNIFNSVIFGDVKISYRENSGFNPLSGLFVNSMLIKNPRLSKLVASIKNNTETILVDEFTNPYPQFLVTQ